MSGTNLDDLNKHLFETIEMLKNNNLSEDKVSENEKIDIDTAKTICSIGKVIVEGYKVKVQAIGLLNPEQNPKQVKSLLEGSGI